MTERQEDIVRAIRDAIAEHGYAPTVREIAHAVGLSSASTVLYHLRRLERQGIIRRDDHRTARRYRPAN
ncbi:winged helix-turn-helix transcriptional regulator [Streptomyces sp. B6B3]|uniref:LexA family protein n=1 Tax=Streptomyces sp. B6B3 TaxID=3153570 RepID=UPI00325C7DA0